MKAVRGYQTQELPYAKQSCSLISIGILQSTDVFNVVQALQLTQILQFSDQLKRVLRVSEELGTRTIMYVCGFVLNSRQNNRYSNRLCLAPFKFLPPYLNISNHINFIQCNIKYAVDEVLLNSQKINQSIAHILIYFSYTCIQRH